MTLPNNTPTSEYSKKNPFPSTLKEKTLLNGQGSAKETLHFEFDLAGSGLSYDVGDALALIPENCPEMVNELIALGNFNPNDAVVLPSKTEGPLAEALLKSFDITGLTKNTLRKYNAFAQSEKIETLLDPENKDALQEYLYGREIIDMLVDFPAPGLTAADFASILRKLQPRLYSIASSIQAHPEEVHLTVAIVRYQSHGRSRKGVTTSHLADRMDVQSTAPVFVHKNKNFRLPQDPTVPIIMVGPGTGVAPFRAFIEERQAIQATGKNWLFFGDQHASCDFLYESEWEQYQKSGLLTKLSVAFSRDTETKYYVQHSMLENSKELYAWLETGAHFYVCGDASRMAGDVHTALIQIISQEGNISEEDATAYVDQMKKDKRYQRDVY